METIRLSELPNPGKNPVIDKQIEIFARELLRLSKCTPTIDGRYYIVEVNALEWPLLKEHHPAFDIYEEKIQGRMYTVSFSSLDERLIEIR